VILHDEIYGVVPRRFNKVVLEVAQSLFDYMNTEKQVRKVMKDYNPETPLWKDQPETFRKASEEMMKRFAAKVREIRDQHLGQGWLTDVSVEFEYLMAHAQRYWFGL
jgi:hypothetical protein